MAVDDRTYFELPLTPALNWFRECVGTLVVGGTYLAAGQPGIGKSRMSLQLALDVGRQGERSLYIMTEEPKSRLKGRAQQMCSNWSPAERELAMSKVLPEDTVFVAANRHGAVFTLLLRKSDGSGGGDYFGYRTQNIELGGTFRWTTSSSELLSPGWGCSVAAY